MKLQYKATVDIDTMKYMNENIDKLEEWYDFSYKLLEMFSDVPDDGRMIKPPFSLASLVVPGKYTIEDGEIFAEFVLNTIKIQRQSFGK